MLARGRKAFGIEKIESSEDYRSWYWSHRHAVGYSQACKSGAWHRASREENGHRFENHRAVMDWNPKVDHLNEEIGYELSF